MKIPTGILGLIAIVAVGYVASGWFKGHLIAMATGTAPTCLEMLSSTTTEEEGLTSIVGSIKNNCDHKFGQVTVVFKLDRVSGPTEDLPEAVAYAYSRDVGPGETRQFKTPL